MAVPSHCDRPLSKPGRWYSVYAAAVDVNDGDDDPPPNNDEVDDALCCDCASWTARERSTFAYDALLPATPLTLIRSNVGISAGRVDR